MHIDGSSPHTRGAPHPARRDRRRHRIIPAYAGMIRRFLGGPARGPDHPRIRGEHAKSFQEGVDGLGSSPHTRGALSLLRHWLRQRRIIPAYAGSTARPGPSARPRRDHPRIRGEHGRRPPPYAPPPGSSPHTRGALGPGHRRDERRRIIPAYAGSTAGAAKTFCRRRDHPRIRGEHAGSHPGSMGGAGSSPHTRGARKALPLVSARVGIIPAYAGSTEGYLVGIVAGGDHPRIRGEHAPGYQAIAVVFRIIPAYAGSTLLSPSRLW